MQITHTQLVHAAKKVPFGDLKNGEMFYTEIDGEEERGLCLFVKMENFYHDSDNDDDKPVNTVPVGWEADFHVNTVDDDMVIPVNFVEVS